MLAVVGMLGGGGCMTLKKFKKGKDQIRKARSVKISPVKLMAKPWNNHEAVMLTLENTGETPFLFEGLE